MKTETLYPCHRARLALYDPEIPIDYEEQHGWLFCTLSKATAIATGDRFFKLLVEALATSFRIGPAPADFCSVIVDPETTMPGLDFIDVRNPEDNQPLISAVKQVAE